jgi:fumagillin biosynthesis polyketide synthase
MIPKNHRHVPLTRSKKEYGKLWDKDLEYHQNYHAVGTGEAIYANRISHVYDLAGPSMAFDTGCSGSLVGLDIACRYLSAGLIEGCFVGGTNLTLIPEVLSRKPRLLSKSGQCHTFDSLADGFSRADATSIVYLKRLDDAIRDGDPIRAVVRGTSNGFDGRTPGILMPSKEAQVANLLQAYANAGISQEEFGQTAYFECHGTGTPTGDPIEVDAVGKVFAKHKSVDSPLLIGSAKTNLGRKSSYEYRRKFTGNQV